MMTRKIMLFLVVLAAFVLLGVYAYRLAGDNADLRAENARSKANADVLAGQCERYRTSDSLNGARVRALELSLDEFERYRAQDAQVIKSLKQRNRDLESITSTQSQTIIELRAAPKDTVIIRDSVPVKAKAVECGDPWYSFKGVLTDTDFSGRLETRDSLIISESVEHKRFLGILWKTRKVKNRQIDAVNRSPHSKIADIVFVVIED